MAPKCASPKLVSYPFSACDGSTSFRIKNVKWFIANQKREKILMIIWDLLTSSPITAPRPFVPLFALPLVPTIVDVFTLLFTEFPFKFVAALTWLFGMVAAVVDIAAATAVPAALTFVCFKLSKNKIYRIFRMNIIYRIIRKKRNECGIQSYFVRRLWIK